MKPANPRKRNRKASPNPPVIVRNKCIIPSFFPSILPVILGRIEYTNPKANCHGFSQCGQIIAFPF